MMSVKQMAVMATSAALFIETIDTTILNTAIPMMASSLHTEVINLKIALISYCLTIAIFVPISGWLANRFGAKTIFMQAIGIFILSSLGCGFAQTTSQLVFFRSLQGIGGAIMLPVGRLILLQLFEKHEVIQVISRVAISGALGGLLGPVFGGIITQYWSWSWIFWINVPIGILILGVTYFSIPNFPTQTTQPLDFKGFILFGLSLASLTFGLSTLGEINISYMTDLLFFLFSLIFFIWYFRHNKKVQYPLIKTELFQFRSFALSMLGNITARLGFGGVPFLLPILFQTILQYSPYKTGLLLTPWALGTILAKTIALPLIQNLGYRRLLILNTLSVALSVWSFTIITANTSLYYVVCCVFIYGFLISLQYSGMNSLAYADINPRDLGSANSILGIIQQLTGSIGVAVCAILIRLFQYSNQEVTLSEQSVHSTFFLLGCIILLSTFVFKKLHREDGQTLLQRTS